MFSIQSSGISKFLNLGLLVFRRLSIFLRRITAILFGSQVSEAEFQKFLHVDMVDFLASVREQRSRHFFIQPQNQEEIIGVLLELCPQAKLLIIQAADRVFKHYFNLLGSGPSSLGWPIDWHADFKSGFRWDPTQYYADIRPAPYPGGYDLKVPWELSRCQHFIWLGQAYWLTSDEKYAREFRFQVEDWIRQNPPEFGVNWACSMDIAIRAVNWLWGYAFFRSSPILDDDFRVKFYKSLWCHGRHIRANLEGTVTFRGNHYLSDIVGLVYLGILVPELKEARAWREFGLQELETEMFKQVYPDGGNFEASTSYHRLVTELFLSSTLLAKLNGYTFSRAYMQRLEKMLEFIYQITKPDGTVPIIGDQDNGRLHRLKVWANPDMEWKDFRSLLAPGSILFDKPEWGKAAGDHWEEAIWFYGRQAIGAFQKSSQLSQFQMRAKGFENTGIYILRADDMYVAVDTGPVGQNGKGGHAHNDTLSFELFSSGQTWIQDPGTYVYTADYEARNLLRSTAFHNTLTVPGYEQNGCDVMKLFSLKNESVCNVLSWQVEPTANVWLEGEVRRLTAPKIIHRRSFHLCPETRTLLLTDIARNSKSTLALLFHFAPGLEPELVEEPYAGIKLINSEGKIAWIFSISPVGVTLGLSQGWISESYGKRVRAWVASIKSESIVEHKTVILLPGDTAISHRIAKVIKDEDNVH